MTLERRYRWLLGWYPADHVREYGDEMLGVLMAGARPGQRMPGFRETVDLLLSAIRRRLGRLPPARPGPQWIDAAAACGVLAAIMLLGRQLRPLAYHLATSARGFPSMPSLFSVDGIRLWGLRPALWLLAALWVVVVVAVLGRRPRVAAVTAWVVTLTHAAIVVAAPVDYAIPPHVTVWSLVLAATTATLLSVPGGARRGLAVLGGRRTALVGAAGLVTVLAPIVEVFRYQWSSGIWYLDSATHTWLQMSAYGVAAVVIFGTIATLPAPVRRRVFTLLATIGAALTVVQLRAGFVIREVGLTIQPPLLVGAAWWPLLVTLPLAVFLAGTLIVRRRERSAPD